MTKMKESGIDWIGKIPEEWEVIKVKFFTYMKGRIGWQGLKADEFIDEGPYLVTGTDFKNGRVNWDTAYHISQKRYEQAPEIQLKQGDLLVTKDGTVGKLALIDELPDSASLNSHLLVLRPLFNRYDNHFLYYVLSSLEFKNYFQKVSIGSTMDSLSQEKMGEFIFALPNINEQNSISRYLDKKTAQLDKAKALLEEQIQKLKDYRASLIYETVTKGLDKTAPLKDSGIDWIGQVPQGWEMVKFKYFFNTSKGLSITKECLVDDGIPVINYGQIHSSMSKQVQSCDVRLPFVPDYYLSKKGANLNQGDFVFADTSEDLEGAGNFSTRIDSTGPLLAGYHTIIARLNNYDEYDFRYFMHLFDSLAIRKQIQNKVSGIKVYSITQGILNSIFVIIPPKSEQQRIANLLDEKTAQIDKLVQIKNQQIENINKQRQTLIYDYVTGKRRV